MESWREESWREIPSVDLYSSAYWKTLKKNIMRYHDSLLSSWTALIYSEYLCWNQWITGSTCLLVSQSTKKALQIRHATMETTSLHMRIPTHFTLWKQHTAHLPASRGYPISHYYNFNEHNLSSTKELVVIAKGYSTNTQHMDGQGYEIC
jgi:hypothetical protein